MENPPPLPDPLLPPLRTIQNDGGAREFLMNYHWLVALQEAFIENLHETPLRYIICDDSNMMSQADGSILV